MDVKYCLHRRIAPHGEAIQSSGRMKNEQVFDVLNASCCIFDDDMLLTGSDGKNVDDRKTNRQWNTDRSGKYNIVKIGR